MRTASLNPISGLDAIADQTRMNQIRISSSRNLIRSHRGSGLRVGRSSSRGRPPGGRSPSGEPAGAIVIMGS